ncbi:MAG: hypothetical protein AAF721_03860 [Myxococcota bacterium]
MVHDWPVAEHQDEADTTGSTGHATSPASTSGSPEDEGDASGEEVGGFLWADFGAADGWECDPFKQNCPTDEKCTVWAPDGGSWNATRCAAIVDDPDREDEPCMAIGSGTSGLDTCDAGLVCWDVDADSLAGTCVAFCTGDVNNPGCADPEKVCVGSSATSLCHRPCDPLQPIVGPAGETDAGLAICALGRGCHPLFDHFFCVIDVSGEMGAPGDSCSFLGACDHGSICAAPVAAAVCRRGADGCCLPLCDLRVASAGADCAAFDPTTTCIPWYRKDAPAGYEDVGVCAAPA